MSLHESQQMQRPTLTADLAAGGKVCPVCHRETPDEFVPMLFKQTIKYNFGINVDYYAMVNFSGVVGAVGSPFLEILAV